MHVIGLFFFGASLYLYLLEMYPYEVVYEGVLMMTLARDGVLAAVGATGYIPFGRNKPRSA